MLAAYANRGRAVDVFNYGKHMIGIPVRVRQEPGIEGRQIFPVEEGNGFPRHND